MSALLTPTVDVYLSGPMSGYPNLNIEAFEDAANVLRDRGHTVVSPHEFIQNLDALEREEEEEDKQPASARAGYLRFDVTQVANANRIVMLKGWEESVGANVELAVARMLGMPAIEFETGRTDFGPNWPLIWTHIADLSEEGAFNG